jgi:hypothetical protein
MSSGLGDGQTVPYRWRPAAVQRREQKRRDLAAA